jgi:hypothetical protein
MRRLHVVTCLAAASCVLGAPRALTACDCLQLKPLSTDVRDEARVIFSGTVVEIVERNEHLTTTFDGGAKTSVQLLERSVNFRVIAGWRGVTQQRVTLAADFSDCMFPFEIGRPYLVFAVRNAQGRPSTSICQRTKSLAEATEVLRMLGAPTYVAR